MLTKLKEIIEWFGNCYCELFHKEITRPVKGHYICMDCAREWKSCIK